MDHPEHVAVAVTEAEAAAVDQAVPEEIREAVVDQAVPEEIREAAAAPASAAEAVVPGEIGHRSEKIQDLIDRQIITRQAEPEDVWRIVSLLLSDDADMISGQVINVGGA